MPRRTTFTDSLTGRFISAADAGEMEGVIRSVYDGGLIERQIMDFGEIREDLTPEADANWIEDESKWGSRWHANDNPLSLSALQGAGFPEEFDSYRVTYFVQNNPDYPRKFASTEWFTDTQWPPDLSLLEGVSVTGIASIFFRSK